MSCEWLRSDYLEVLLVLWFCNNVWLLLRHTPLFYLQALISHYDPFVTSQVGVSECFDLVFKPLQTHCLRTSVSRQDVLTGCLSTGYGKVQFTSAGGVCVCCWPWRDTDDGKTMGRRCYCFVSIPLLDLRLMVSHNTLRAVRLFPVKTDSMSHRCRDSHAQQHDWLKSMLCRWDSYATFVRL